MAWRDRKRRELIIKYRLAASLTTVPDLATFACSVCQNKQSAFSISAISHAEQVQIVCTHRYRLPVTVDVTELRLEPVRFQPDCRHRGHSFDNDVKVSIIPLHEFHVRLTRISFQTIRKERQHLFSEIEEASKSRPRIRQVKVPAPPPSFQGKALDERLRWILTPPIHELLSDPQLALPERPFPFQTEGIKWLYYRDSTLLADEMGLGKTMQAIIAGRLLWREGLIEQVLVVCPKTLIPTWQDEIRKWWPQISANVMLCGQDRQFFLRLGTPNVTIKIINYASLAREAQWLEQQTFEHDLVIIDEAQRIKNPKAKTSRAVKALRARKRWALTGTPLENRVEDLISICNFIRPQLFPAIASQAGTRGRYAFSDDAIREKVGPYLLRRRAEEVLDDLPDKSEQDIGIELGTAQRETYRRMEEEGVIELNEKGDSITVTHVFALINKLRQICNFDPVTGRSAKLERLLEDLEEISESGRKALIFSQFVADTCGLKRLAQELERKGHRVLQLHGQIPQNRRQSVREAFESDGSVVSLLLNYQVGGVGLNLQVANYVFLFDRWWNPAVEDQAVKRVHRIGQTQKVFIRRLYCHDTIEERILAKLREKRRLFRSIVDDVRPEPDSMGLTEEEIFSLFNITVRPRKAAHEKRGTDLVLENLDPTQFEVLVTEIYEKQGYAVHHYGGSHDGGIDILAEKQSAGGMERIVIQCKHQQANVGRPVLQQLWGVVSSDPSYTRGDLVTSSDFTPPAKDFAKGKRLSLIGRAVLAELARRFNVARFLPPPMP